MATGRIPTTANSPLTVKGDLFGYSTTQARVPVGNDGETLVADSSTSTGLRYGANFAAGKNAIINGNFAVWQRGTSFASAANGSFSADRFKYAFDGNGTATISQQAFTAGAAPVAGYESQFFLRHLVTAAGSTTFTQIFQPIEDVRTFAGQSVTFSFWAKADTTRSSFIYAEQNFGSGGSATVQYLSMGSASLTTSWQRFSFTVALSSISGKTIGTNSQLNFYIRGGTSLNASTDIWGVQLEAGSVATAFQTATGTIQGELAACQRYYYRWTSSISATTACMGYPYSTSGASLMNNFPVTMRTAPSLATSTVSLFNMAGAGFSAGVTSIGLGNATPTTGRVDITCSPASLTAGTCVEMRTNSTTATFLEFSSEL